MDYSEFFASKIDAKEVSSQWFEYELLNFINEVKFPAIQYVPFQNSE